MAETARVVPLRAEAAPHRARMLGAFRLTWPDGTDATPKARKTRALLAFLLVTRRSWTRERLANLLWSDRADEQAKASLRQALYELRALAIGPDPLLVVRRDEVEVRAQACELDLDHVMGLARAGDLVGLASALEAADLTLLADLAGAGRDFDEWLAWEQHQTRERLLAASVEAGESALAEGRVAETRRLADVLEGLDGLNEPAARLGLAADRMASDLSSLRRRYDRFARRLQADLDAEPALETQALLRPSATRAPAKSAAAPPPVAALPRPPAWRWLAVTMAILVVAAIGVWRWSNAMAPPASPSVAVLPFRAAGGANDAAFGAGVSEAVLEGIARGKKLRVVGSASARLLAAKGDALQTARRLGVDYVLEGDVRRTGLDRVSADVRLIRVRDGRRVWSGAYQRPAADVFAVQNEISAAVAQTLGARIAPLSNPHLTTRADVYDRYLQARSLARERRTAPLLEAHRLLSEAAALDPDYAPAFASLAQVTMLLADHPTSYGDIPIPQAQAEARRYARRALELAPELADAYAAYGLISLSDAQSLPFYARAVVLEPQRPEFHRWLGQAYSAVGREGDALAEYRRAAALDPLLWLTMDHLAGQLAFMGRQDEAAAVVERFARVSTDPHGVARVQASLASQQGRLADYVRLTETAAKRWPAERTLTADYAKAWSILGENERAARVLPAREVVGRLALTGDAEGLAREARRMGPAFWQTEPGYWDFAERLVTGGHGALLLQLYDAEFDSVDDVFARAPSKALPVGPALIAALNQAGRYAEANALAGRLLDRLDADVAAGMDPGHAAYDRAAILALTGQRARALEQLAAAVRGNWVNMAWFPAKLSERLPFRSLRGDPRLASVQAELDAKVNKQRALLGLPPLKN